MHVPNSNSSSSSKSIDWSILAASQKKAKGIDDYDLGEVQVIGTNYVLTQRGTINRQRFYIPKYLVEGYDRDVVRFKVTKDDAENKFARDSPPSADEYSKYKTPQVPQDIETRIPVLAERLEVSKTESSTEATVIKEPVVETKTVEVPLTHEEVVVERRPVSDVNATDKKWSQSAAEADEEGVVESRTEINIPLKREDIQVNKEPYVKEELVVKKKPVTETRTITEEIRSEKVTVKDPDGKNLEEEG
jgi:uncharacterized protein (TIGR02271 family)